MVGLAAAGLVGGIVALAGAPADAFCVTNASKVPVEVRLQSLSPLSDFASVVNTGSRVCCDWLYRKCNPSAGRNALLTVSIIGYGVQYRDFYCSGLVARRTMAVSDGEITVLDDATQLGGLRCDSRSFAGQDVHDPNRYRSPPPRRRARPSTP